MNRIPFEKIVCAALFSAGALVAPVACGETVPVGGAAFHFDASASDTLTVVQENGTNYVTRWDHASGGSRYAAAQQGGSRPYLSEVAGLPVVDFGRYKYCNGYGSSKQDGIGGYLHFSEGDANIREVFLVVADNAQCEELKQYNHLLGASDTSHYHFHRGSAGELFDSNAAGSVRSGLIEMNLTVFDSSRILPAGRLNLVHLRTTASVFASSLACDRTIRYGGLVYGEILIYDSVLSDADADSVCDYLAEKWDIEPASPFPVKGAVFHFDAADTDAMTISQENGTNYVSRWNCSTGPGRYAETPQGHSRPFLSEFCGKTVVDFGHMYQPGGIVSSKTPGIGGWLNIKEGATISEAFIVVADREECAEMDKYNFFLGSAKIYQFHRGDSGALFSTANAGVHIQNGLIELNWESVGPTAKLPAGQLNLIHLRPTSDAWADTLANDRGIRYGGLRYGEIVLFNKVLSDENANKICKYLAEKWGLASPTETKKLTVTMPMTDILNAPTYSVEPDERGAFPADSDVAITVTAKDPATTQFERWYGDVPEGHETDNPLTIRMDRDKKVVPYFRGPWQYDETSKTINNGYWTFPTSGEMDALTVRAPTSVGMVPIIDLSPGLMNGTISGIAEFWLYRLPTADKEQIEEVRFPDTMKTIAKWSMAACPSLRSVTLPSQLESFDDCVFNGSRALEEILPETFADTVSFLGIGPFVATAALKADVVLSNKNLTIDGVESWLENGFYQSGIVSLDLSASGLVETPRAFVRECPNLRTVKYPKTLQRLGHDSHYGSSKMTDIWMPSLPEQFNVDSQFVFTPGGGAGRIVYQGGDPAWLAFFASQKAVTNCCTWADAAPALREKYLENFPASPRPTCYIELCDNPAAAAKVGKWFVPHNFNRGLTIVIE